MMTSLNVDVNDDITRPAFIKYFTMHSNLLLIHYDVACRYFLQNKCNANKKILYIIIKGLKVQSYKLTN